MFRKRGINSSAQVWIETVICTLIGLTIIGVLLAVTKPKIDEMKDRLIIEQSIEALNRINERIYDVRNYGYGNKRIVNLKISKGKFIINSTGDKISWIMDSKAKYSEPGTPVSIGNMEVLTIEASPWQVKLEISYNVDLRYNNENVLKEFEQAPTPYELQIENLGDNVISLSG